MKKSLVSLIVLAVLVVALVGTVIGVVAYSNSPKVIVRNALSNTVEDALERDEVKPLANTLKKGSLEIKGTLDMEEYGALMKDCSFGGKLYFKEDALMLENANIAWGDKSYSADAYVSAEKIYVSSDELLDGTYGLVHGENDVEISDSFLAEFMDEESMEQLQSLLDSYHDKNMKKEQKKTEKIIEDYSKFIVKSIEDLAEYEKETKNVKVGGERIKARVTTVTLSTEDVAKIIEELYDKVQDDDDLKELIDPDDKMFDDMLEEAEPAIKNMVEGLEDVDATITAEFVTPKTSSKLLMLTVSAKYNKNTQEIFVLDLGEKGIAKTDRIELTLLDRASVVYEIKEKTSKLYNATVEIDAGGFDASLDIELDASKKEFEISVKNGEDDKIVLSGDYIKKGKTRTLTWNKLRFGKETFEDFSLSFILKEKDSMPKPVKDDDVDSVLSIKDPETIVDKFEEIFDSADAEGAALAGKTYESMMLGTGTTLDFTANSATISMKVMDEVIASATVDYEISTNDAGVKQIQFFFDEGAVNQTLANEFGTPASLEIGSDYIVIDETQYTLVD